LRLNNPFFFSPPPPPPPRGPYETVVHVRFSYFAREA
jgi:hypothetical protein